MQLLTMLNEMRGYIFMAFTTGVHKRSPPIPVFCLCICTCSECNATNDTTRHPLHVHCYSYEEDLKRHSVLSTVSPSTIHYKSHYIHTQHTSALLNNMHISCIVQSEIERSFMHTTTLTHTTITMGTYSDTLQDWQHLTNVQHMQQVYQLVY